MNTVGLQAKFNEISSVSHWGIIINPDGVIGPQTDYAFKFAEAKLGPNWFDTGLPPDRFWVDSYQPATREVADLIKQETGVYPVAWGRYLGSIHPAEIDLFAELGIDLVAIDNGSVRLVCGDHVTGTHLGKQAVDRLMALTNDKTKSRLGYTIFLDIESSPNLSADFYHGWALAVCDAGAVPAVYIPNYKYHPESWIALERAIADGAPCAGTWSAWYEHQTADQINHYSAHYFREDWHPDGEGHEMPGIDIPHIARQYIGNSGLTKNNRLVSAVDFSNIHPCLAS